MRTAAFGAYTTKYKTQNTAFKKATDIKPPSAYKAAHWFISTEEKASGVSVVGFLRSFFVSWLPPAIMSRSVVDLADKTFLEASEGALFYGAPGLVGDKVSKKVFSKFLPKNLKKFIADSAEDIKNNKAIDEKSASKLKSIKTAIILSCACIPAAEYALPFLKNLFTLKVFDQADFNNIANLNENQQEDPEHQKQVKKSAKEQVKNAGIFSALTLGLSGVFALFGHKSKTLQRFSDVFLQPGQKIYNGLEKLGLKSEKTKNFLKKYINFDFKKGKGNSLHLSKGQLALSVIAGCFGYHKAAEDRGELEKKEVDSRVLAVVAPYLIFGEDFIHTPFKKYLHKTGNYTDLIKENDDKSLKVLSLKEIEKLAKEKAIANGTTIQSEWNRLFKAKAKISLAPVGFGFFIVGLAVAGINRFWTQYRYEHGVGKAVSI